MSHLIILYKSNKNFYRDYFKCLKIIFSFLHMYLCLFVSVRHGNGHGFWYPDPDIYGG